MFADVLALAFMRHAFLAVTAVAVAGSLVGYFVVLRRQTFATHALSHVGFAGAAGATLVGIAPLFGLLGFMLLAALGIAILGTNLRDRDVGVGMVLMFSLALGLLFLNLYSANAGAATSILFGNVLGISQGQVTTTLGLSGLVVICLLVMYRPLRFASIYEAAAQARGVSIRRVGVIFMLILGLALAISVPVIGALLSFAIFVGPAAAAQLCVRRIASGLCLALVFALGESWLGLAAAYYIGYPVTVWIASLSFFLYATVYLTKYGLKIMRRRRTGTVL